MSKLINHRQSWTNAEEDLLIEVVKETIVNGGTQRDAFRQVADMIGRTMGGVEYHWKKLRKENPEVFDIFQQAVADSLIEAVNHPEQQHDPDVIEDHMIHEITKGATRIHAMIEQIIHPDDMVAIPLDVVEIIEWEKRSGDVMNLYNRKYLERMECDTILDFIDASPENARNYHIAIEHGYRVDYGWEDKFVAIYRTLNKIKPNEPGYMMARGMIVMMYHSISIMGHDPLFLIGSQPKKDPILPTG